MVEVWNENTMFDDLIGRTDLPLPSCNTSQPGAAMRFYHLDTGGEIALSVARVS